MMIALIYILFCAFGSILDVVASLQLVMTNSAPVVSGGIVHFKAELFDGGNKATGSFRYEWMDNSLLRHSRTYDSKKPIDQWSVNYTAEDCPPGEYIMQLKVYKYYLIPIPIFMLSARNFFNLTNTLNGELQFYQQNKTINTDYVSNSSILLHKVILQHSDFEYLNNSASQILTYWFVDCNYYGITTNLEFAYNYTEVDCTHIVDALVIPNFEPFPTEAPITTTTTTIPTTAKAFNNQKPYPTRIQRDVNVITNLDSTDHIIYKGANSKIGSINGTVTNINSFPFICQNHTIVPMPSTKPYGHFSRVVNVKEPIKNIDVAGNNWLQRSEVLHLQVSCNGSSTYNYCYYFVDGMYNTTGNETCPSASYKSNVCLFHITRYFYDNNARTIVIIISNDVSANVTGVAVNIYKVNKQAQVSLIVVPVVFSLVAIVLIIFGVAYYLQNRSRFIIEVANFNFEKQFGDLEYKTFTERLKDSFSYTFTRAPISSSSSDGSVWHTGEGSTNKYDTMP